MKKTNQKHYFNPISRTVLVLLIGITIALFGMKIIEIPLLIGLLIASIFIASSIHIASTLR